MNVSKGPGGRRSPWVRERPRPGPATSGPVAPWTRRSRWLALGAGCAALGLVAPADLPAVAEQRGFPPALADTCSPPPRSIGTAHDDDAGRQAPTDRSGARRDPYAVGAPGEPPGEVDDHGETHLDDVDGDDPTPASAIAYGAGAAEAGGPSSQPTCRGPPRERPPEPLPVEMT